MTRTPVVDTTTPTMTSKEALAAERARKKQELAAEKERQAQERKEQREAKRLERKAAERVRAESKRIALEERVKAARKEELIKLVNRVMRWTSDPNAKENGKPKRRLNLEYVNVEENRVWATDGKTAIIVETGLPIAEEIGAWERPSGEEDSTWTVHNPRVVDVPEIDKAIKLTKPNTWAEIEVAPFASIGRLMREPGSYVVFHPDKVTRLSVGARTVGNVVLTFESHVAAHVHTRFGLDALYLARALDFVEESKATIIGESSTSPFHIRSGKVTAIVMPVKT